MRPSAPGKGISARLTLNVPVVAEPAPTNRAGGSPFVTVAYPPPGSTRNEAGWDGGRRRRPQPATDMLADGSSVSPDSSFASPNPAHRAARDGPPPEGGSRTDPCPNDVALLPSEMESRSVGEHHGPPIASVSDPGVGSGRLGPRARSEATARRNALAIHMATSGEITCRSASASPATRET